MLSTYAVLAYVSTPYMTREHGIHWMMMIIPRSCVHIFTYIYVMHVSSSEFPSILSHPAAMAAANPKKVTEAPLFEGAKIRRKFVVLLDNNV